LDMGWPADLTPYKLLTDWGSLIAGTLGFGAAIVAVLLAMRSERRKAKRALESLRRALGVEVRQYTANAYRAHRQCKDMIVRRSPDARIPAILVEDKTKLPPPHVFPNAVAQIGDFGTCAANLLLFFNRVAVTREAAERLLRHPSADNLPSDEVAWAVEGLIKIAELGTQLLPFLKTGIETEDSTDADAIKETDADAIKEIEEEAKDWAARRNAFGVS
jgi:hypothetical protein